MRTIGTLTLALLAVALATPAMAQPSWQNQLAVTGGPQLPHGPLADDKKTGSGLALTYYHRPTSHLFLGLRGGYHRFEPKTSGTTLNVVPIHFASKLNFTLTGIQPYVGLDGGLYLIRPEGRDNTSEFGLAPKFGFRFPVASGVDIDLHATYEVILDEQENTTYFGVNGGIAYIFGR